MGPPHASVVLPLLPNGIPPLTFARLRDFGAFIHNRSCFCLCMQMSNGLRKRYVKMRAAKHKQALQIMRHNESIEKYI